MDDSSGLCFEHVQLNLKVQRYRHQFRIEKIRNIFILKTNPLFGECYTCFGYETKSGVVRNLVIFNTGPMFSHINGKLSPRPLE